eukprot:COSAG01_NODE_320_length_18904_cov_45.662537_6_plen_58_part_00
MGGRSVEVALMRRLMGSAGTSQLAGHAATMLSTLAKAGLRKSLRTALHGAHSGAAFE